MKRFVPTILILVFAAVFAGCVGVTQTITPPTPASTIAPAATDVPTQQPTATVVPTQPTATKPIPLPTRPLQPNPSPQIPPPIDSRPTSTGGPVITDPTLLKLVADAKADLVTRANVTSGTITIKSAEAVEWRDSSLGCPKPGIMYTQVITPGYLIVLEVAGKEWNYHASQNNVMYCDK